MIYNKFDISKKLLVQYQTELNGRTRLIMPFINGVIELMALLLNHKDSDLTLVRAELLTIRDESLSDIDLENKLRKTVKSEAHTHAEKLEIWSSLYILRAFIMKDVDHFRNVFAAKHLINKENVTLDDAFCGQYLDFAYRMLTEHLHELIQIIDDEMADTEVMGLVGTFDKVFIEKEGSAMGHEDEAAALGSGRQTPQLHQGSKGE